MFANHYAQAYDKRTYNAELAFDESSTSATPQPANTPWQPNAGSGYCGLETADYDVSYDHMDAVWALAGTSVPATGQSNAGHSFLCTATSTTDNLYQTCSFNACPSYWSAFAFDVTSLMPSDNGVPDFADYARFGTWNDKNYYMTFDFVDNNSNSSNYGQVQGFAACQLNGTNIRAGNTSAVATCYVYAPAAYPPLIHTLLPADVENSSYPSTTKGEFFLATVNPGTGDGSPCDTGLCSSDELAFWTWDEITSKSSPTYISTSSFTPGCYDDSEPGNTVCVAQPGTSNIVDSVGDRLMSRLAYRYVSGTPSYEYLAVTQTIETETSPVHLPAIRYYTVVTPSGTPAVQYSGNLGASSTYYWMPSNAIDKRGNVAYTFSVDDSSSTYPSVYADTLNSSGVVGTATVVKSGSGSIKDSLNNHWGEYVSTTIDPGDDQTFWSVGQFFAANESNCHAGNTITNTCIWKTEVFRCTKGDSLCP
jgi:hypothetical protein